MSRELLNIASDVALLPGRLQLAPKSPWPSVAGFVLSQKQGLSGVGKLSFMSLGR